MNNRALTFAVVVALLASSTTASADDFDAALSRAVAAKELAIDDPTPLHWQRAFDLFLEADTMAPSAETKYELGYIAAQLRQEDLAVEYYESSIESGLTGPATAKARSFVETHGPRMARVVVHGASGIRIRIRGIDRGTLPLSRPLVVFAGDVKVEFFGPNHATASSRTVTLIAGHVNEVDGRSEEAIRPESNPAATTDQPPATLASNAPLPTKVAGAVVAPTRPIGATRDQGQSGRTAGKWLLGSGVGVLLSSGAMLTVSMVKLSDRRKHLRDACEEPLPNSEDGCSFTRPGRYDEALAIADAIARWRTVQGVAWVGVGVGALASVGGWALLSRKAAPVGAAARWVPMPTIGFRSAHVSWSHEF